MRKFVEIDEAFTCENCGYEVKPLGYSSRNHCPKCLHSKHVDVNPGDRAEDCEGLLVPINVENNSKKGQVIIFRCKKCGQIRRNKVAEDDDFDEIIRVIEQSKFLI